MIVEIIANLLTKKKKSGIIEHKAISKHKQRSLCGEECKNNMSVKNITNHVIREYWNSRVGGLRISCTRTKIGKMLTIIQILSLKCRREIAFDELIVSETCGTSVPILSVYRYPYDIWELNKGRTLDEPFQSRDDFFERNSRMSKDEVERINEDIPKLYEIQQEICGPLQRIIEDVFYEFGAYDSYEIGKLINDFKDKICIKEVVDEEMIGDWLKEIQGQPTDNELIKFIAEYEIGRR